MCLYSPSCLFNYLIKLNATTTSIASPTAQVFVPCECICLCMCASVPQFVSASQSVAISVASFASACEYLNLYVRVSVTTSVSVDAFEAVSVAARAPVCDWLCIALYATDDIACLHFHKFVNLLCAPFSYVMRSAVKQRVPSHTHTHIHRPTQVCTWPHVSVCRYKYEYLHT